MWTIEGRLVQTTACNITVTLMKQRNFTTHVIIEIRLNKEHRILGSN